MGWNLFFRILKILGIGALIIAIFYVLFIFLVKKDIVVTPGTITTYQLKDLTILYISSCATTLALIVALLRDEIRNFFTSAKIVIKPKSPLILNEDYDKTLTTNIKAESYQVIVNVRNNGSLHVHSCSISLTDLVYIDLSAHSSLVDVSLAKNINWIGKNEPIAHLHSYGGKSDVSILQIKTNDASTTDESLSQPVKLFIGGIDVSIEHTPTKGSKWIATYMISYDSNRPIKYEIEIGWDGKWHDRLSEMLKNSFEIKEVKK